MNIKNKKNLIIVHNSVWQIINSLECLHIENENASDALFLVLTEENSKSANQIKSFQQKEGLNFFYIFYNSSIYSKVLKYLLLFFNLCGKKFERIFVSQLNISWITFVLNIIKYRNLCFYDEGFHTLQLEKLSNNPLYEYRIGKLNLPISRKKIDLVYTSFNLQHPTLPTKKIGYLRLRNSVAKKQYSTTTYFIGQPVYIHYMSIEDYISRLKTVFKNAHKEIHYYPHRYDSPELLSKIKEIGYQICNNDYPVEYFFIQSNIVPLHVIGFISSALLSLKKIFGEETTIEYIEMNSKKIPHELSLSVQRIYEEFKSEDVLRFN